VTDADRVGPVERFIVVKCARFFQVLPMTVLSKVAWAIGPENGLKFRCLRATDQKRLGQP